MVLYKTTAADQNVDTTEQFPDEYLLSSKLELDCVESENTYILLMDIIKFKLRFIKFVYIF